MRRKGKKLARVARLEALGQLQHPNADGATPGAARNAASETAVNAAAIFGLALEQDDDGQSDSAPVNKCYLWPENVPAYQAWQGLQTQWRIGMDGATGLDYAGVLSYLREVLQIKKKERPALFKSLQAMEIAVLQARSEQQSQSA